MVHDLKAANGRMLKAGWLCNLLAHHEIYSLITSFCVIIKLSISQNTSKETARVPKCTANQLLHHICKTC